jgi:hypothetical protein
VFIWASVPATGRHPGRDHATARPIRSSVTWPASCS